MGRNVRMQHSTEGFIAALTQAPLYFSSLLSWMHKWRNECSVTLSSTYACFTLRACLTRCFPTYLDIQVYHRKCVRAHFLQWLPWKGQSQWGGCDHHCPTKYSQVLNHWETETAEPNTEKEREREEMQWRNQPTQKHKQSKNQRKDHNRENEAADPCPRSIQERKKRMEKIE